MNAHTNRCSCNDMYSCIKLIALATKNQVATVHDCDPWTKSITTQIGFT